MTAKTEQSVMKHCVWYFVLAWYLCALHMLLSDIMSNKLLWRYYKSWSLCPVFSQIRIHSNWVELVAKYIAGPEFSCMLYLLLFTASLICLVMKNRELKFSSLQHHVQGCSHVEFELAKSLCPLFCNTHLSHCYSPEEHNWPRLALLKAICDLKIWQMQSLSAQPASYLFIHFIVC